MGIFVLTLLKFESCHSDMKKDTKKPGYKLSGIFFVFHDNISIKNQLSRNPVPHQLRILLVIPMPRPFAPIWQAVQSGKGAASSSSSGNSSRILLSQSMISS